MKPMTQIIRMTLAAALAVAAFSTVADDIGPDKAIEFGRHDSLNCVTTSKIRGNRNIH